MYIFYFSGLFVIDDKGNLRQITMNDLPVGRSVDEALRLVQAFQFTDKHGEGKSAFVWPVHGRGFCDQLLVKSGIMRTSIVNCRTLSL